MAERDGWNRSNEKLRAGVSWTRAEASSLIYALKASRVIQQLAEAHGRTPLAIEMELLSGKAQKRMDGGVVRDDVCQATQLSPPTPAQSVPWALPPAQSVPWALPPDFNGMDFGNETPTTFISAGPNQEKFMNQACENNEIDGTKAVQDVTYIYGKPASQVTDANIFEFIHRKENEIRQLELISNKPNALMERLNEIRAEIMDLVNFSDKRNKANKARK